MKHDPVKWNESDARTQVLAAGGSPALANAYANACAVIPASGRQLTIRLDGQSYRNIVEIIESGKALNTTMAVKWALARGAAEVAKLAENSGDEEIAQQAAAKKRAKKTKAAKAALKGGKHG